MAAGTRFAGLQASCYSTRPQVGSCHVLGLQPPSVHRSFSSHLPGCSPSTALSQCSGLGRTGWDRVKLGDRLGGSREDLSLAAPMALSCAKYFIIPNQSIFQSSFTNGETEVWESSVTYLVVFNQCWR